MPNFRKPESYDLDLILDLHGLKKKTAITKMTNFLDRVRHRHQEKKNLVVTIITGCGNNSAHGPVLRYAVKTTLTRRQMKFVLNPGKGSYSVNAMSGIDLYVDNFQRRDSKVTVVDYRYNKKDLLASRDDNFRFFNYTTSEHLTRRASDHKLNHLSSISCSKKILLLTKYKSFRKNENVSNKDKFLMQYTLGLSLKEYNKIIDSTMNYKNKEPTKAKLQSFYPVEGRNSKKKNS